MTPEFPLAFPLTKNGKVVTVEYPVFINPVTIVKPGAVLRVIYMPPNPNNDSEDLIQAHHGSMEQAYSRSVDEPGDGTKLPSEVEAELDRERKRVWEVKSNFILAMAQMPTYAMHIIFSPTGGERDKDLQDTRFSFFDGMLIGLPNGKVTALAVEDGSRANQAGIKAGDEIVAVADVPVPGDLATFSDVYVEAKKTADNAGVPTFTVTVRSVGQSATHTLAVPMPPTAKSALMHGI